jgi:cellulose synthase/poly-beta-1,6-N-acetylglucosamine synthase-like glycosyltransferase
VYLYGWLKQPTFVTPSTIPSTKISVIIPARNEAANISYCVQSILAQDYPKELLEIIVVDDHSEDSTADIVTAFKEANVKCIKLAEHVYGDEQLVAYKKKALSVGIAHARGQLIVTTDADCTMGDQWLRNIAAIYEKERPVMIVAPVDFTSNERGIEIFQSLDFMSMQGITAASHKLKLGNMSNGANLAFEKHAYEQVNGYAGIDHLASGDDYLLMMKMHKAFPERISYLKAKDAIVMTAPQPDMNSFLQQRIRWASKSGKYDDKKMTAILGFIYLYNLSLFILFIAGFFNNYFFITSIAHLGAKAAIELIYLFPVAGFFGKRKQLFLFPFFQPAHVGYIVVAGLLGFAGVYKWKGRKVR